MTPRLSAAALALTAWASPFAVATADVVADAGTAGDEPVVVDARLDEAFWARAQRFDQFVVTQPFTRGKPTFPTAARIIGLPAGIAIAFEVTQPASAPRLRPQTARDADNPGDRVNVYIDLNADGVVAQQITVALSGSVQDGVITNEVEYATDWDSDWRYAVREEADQWFVEILIPWTTASLRRADTPTRTVGILFDRVYATTSERSAWPGEGFTRQRYLSNFAKVEIDQYRASLFRLWPYVSLRDDLVGDEIESKAGLDLFWKPSGEFQLAATINPDFGQVEADELVVNFDAIETFFSDKRPFFTENHGIFDLRTPNDGYLVYTRRIGGPSDVDGEAADIDVAVKAIGAVGGLGYGVLAALESDYADDLGRAFYVQRLNYPIGEWTFGYLGTYVDRPAIAREALVNAVDATWRPSAAVQVQAQVIASDVNLDDGIRDDYADTGEWLRLFLTPDGPWRHELEASHFGTRLDFNDLGFQPRASYNELEWTTTYTDSSFAETSPIRSIAWTAEPMVRYNDYGDRLPSALYLASALNYRSGVALTFEHEYQFAGLDDLLTRGNGNVALSPRPTTHAVIEFPRRGDFSWSAAATVLHEGLDDPGYEVEFAGTYVINDRFTVDGYIEPHWSDDWLIWRGGNLLGRYERRSVEAGFNANWLPRDGHELRLKLQWLAIDAASPTPYRVGPDGVPRESVDEIEPFEIANFGLQVRYRWTFRPESDFYAVYSRGGFDEEIGDRRGLGDLFNDTFDLRDADQVLLKVRYRF